MRALYAFARWIGVVALAALLSWSVASRWYSLDWISHPTAGHQFVVGSGYGTFYLKSIHTPAWIGGDARLHRPTGFWRHSRAGYRWWFRFIKYGPPSVTGIEIPLWSAVLFIAILCASFWSGRFRRAPGTCPVCDAEPRNRRASMIPFPGTALHTSFTATPIGFSGDERTGT